MGTYPQSPRGAGEPPKGLEMDSGKRLFKAFLGKMPESQPQPSQENGQPSAPPSPAVAWGQPGAPSSSQQVLQTQDWVS